MNNTAKTGEMAIKYIFMLPTILRRHDDCVQYEERLLGKSVLSVNELCSFP